MLAIPVVLLAMSTGLDADRGWIGNMAMSSKICGPEAQSYVAQQRSYLMVELAQLQLQQDPLTQDLRTLQ